MVGKIKDEASDNPIIEFVRLGPKMLHSFEMVRRKADGKMETICKHRAQSIERARAEAFHHRDYLSQHRNPTENYAINRRSEVL